MTDLYEELGVDPKASPEEIDRAYRAKAREHHPDAGGDPEKFKVIARAHQILKDEDDRSRYDKTGQTDDNPMDELHANIASLVANAFGQEKEDPIAFMRRAIRDARRNYDKQMSASKKIERKIKAKLARFEQRNKNTKNTESRDFIAGNLRSYIADEQKKQALLEEQLELGSKMLKFIEGLTYGDEVQVGEFSSRRSSVFPGPDYMTSTAWDS